MSEKKEKNKQLGLSDQEKAINLLSERERAILDEFRRSGKPGLAASVSASFFELYLNGNNVEEIHKINKAFDLGAIIDAKVRYHWDLKRDEYINNLQAKAMSRLLQVQSESVGFLADVLAVAHKKHGTALKKYLQTGNTEDLEGFDINNISTYSKSIEALLKITGQDSKKKIQVEGTVNSNVSINNITEKAMSADQAAAVLEILSQEEESSDN